ncbi:MAG: 30S ribosome-binding factor RbfA [candidate division WOR-3 bacterium]
MKNPARTGRLAHEIARVLSETLLYEAKDEALSVVTIIRVELSGNGQEALVYYSANQEWERAALALERARGFLRTRLAQEIRLRWVPKLTFIPEEI